MNAPLARLLTSLYPRPWRERYGEEFEAHLRGCRGDLRTTVNVVASALHQNIFPTPGLQVNQHSRPSFLQVWGARAPWALFGFGPLLFLFGNYLFACLILWSGWQMFLPTSNSPFVRVDGMAMMYFQIGRTLYFGGPVFVGWALAYIAAGQRMKPLWPTIGLIAIAFVGASAQVHATRPASGGIGQVTMNFALGDSQPATFEALLHASVIFGLAAPPYLFRRWRQARLPAA